MILDLVDRFDPILRAQTQPFDFENPQMDIKELVDNLVDTMVAKRGLGLSAPQVGIPYSVFVMGHPDDKDNIITVINPKIVDISPNTVLGEEGCLTTPGFYVKIKRSNQIRVRFTNMHGETGTTVLEGLSAKTFQHEYDHLNGVLYTDVANKFHLDYAMRQKKKLDKIRKRKGL